MKDLKPEQGRVGMTSLDVGTLAVLSVEDADTADETGVLAGNQHYQDLQLCDATDLDAVLAFEETLLIAFRAGPDAAMAERQFDSERPLEDDRAALWHLDVGVASAVIALVVLGAHPVLSCNGGVFGNPHTFPKPQIQTYLGAADLKIIEANARHAGVRLDQADGLVILTAASCDAFIAFARQALSEARVSPETL